MEVFFLSEDWHAVCTPSVDSGQVHRVSAAVEIREQRTVGLNRMPYGHSPILQIKEPRHTRESQLIKAALGPA